MTKQTTYLPLLGLQQTLQMNMEEPDEPMTGEFNYVKACMGEANFCSMVTTRNFS